MLNGKAVISLVTVRLKKKDSINESTFSRTEIFRKKSES